MVIALTVAALVAGCIATRRAPVGVFFGVRTAIVGAEPSRAIGASSRLRLLSTHHGSSSTCVAARTTNALGVSAESVRRREAASN